MENNALFLGNGHSRYPSKLKLQPMYSNDLLRYPKENPVFITADEYSLRFIWRLSGICLFCPKSTDDYDLSFSFQREVWVLYSKQLYSAKAMQLAQAIQQSGASKILVLWINAQSAGKYHYDRY